MKTAFVRTALATAAFGVLFCAASSRVVGYSSVGHTWGASQVYYYVNPQSSSLSASQVISGVQQAAAVWSQQTKANLQLVYGGTTGGSSLAMDYKNQVFFRNASPGYAGETYWWYDGSGRLVDFDIALYEGGNRFYTGGSGCSGTGIYLEDLVVHEFGHGIGMGHSDVPGATMAAWMPSYCDMTQMTLESDDIAGIEALYPGGSSSPGLPPASPAQLGVSLNPSNPLASLVLAWVDNATNESGYRIERSTDGKNFAQIAQVGTNATSYVSANLLSGTTYYYRVYAYNSVGASGFSNIAGGTTQAPASAPAGPVLSARGYKIKGSAAADLTWSGFSAAMVDVYRNGALTKTTPNDGYEKDTIGKGGGTIKYRACNSGTSTCSATVTVTF
jgi:hypothetical protein